MPSIPSPFTVPTISVELRHVAVGRAPSGFPRVRVELTPATVGHFIGYDPRILAPKRVRSKRPSTGPMGPGHVPDSTVELQRNVQRSVDPHKVAEMVEYLYKAITKGQFGDWPELVVLTSEMPDLEQYEARCTIRMPTKAQYFIADGQHRYCALLDFAKRYPEYSESFTQPVSIAVLPEDKLAEWAGQAFHDMNYLHQPVKLAKALSTDVRDPHNRLAHEMHEHPVIKAAGGVSTTHDTLPPESAFFTTHGILFKMVRGFLEGRKGLDKGAMPDEAARLEELYEDAREAVWAYFDELGAVFPSWADEERRKDYLYRSSAALQALAVVGNDMLRADFNPEARMNALRKVGESRLNWARTNQEWLGILGTPGKDGRVAQGSSRQYIDETIRTLRRRMGLLREEVPETPATHAVENGHPVDAVRRSTPPPRK